MDQDTQPSSEISASLRLRLVRAVRAAQNADDVIDGVMAEFLGISRNEGRCIDIVDRLGRCTAGRLAAESGLTTGTVTALVDRMEAAGYLQRQRDPNDRRKVWIEATEQTRRFNRLLWGHLPLALEPLFARFSAAQILAIVEYMEVGGYVSRQRAALLEEHVLAPTATAAERLAQAEAFAVEARELARCIGDEIRRGRAPRDFADPERD